MITGPQPGRQELFLSTTADIAGFGGQANVGKTVALGLDPLRFLRTGERYGYSARTAMFRRTAKETTEAGGLADKLQELYRPLRAKYRGGKENDFHFDFRSEKGSGSLRIQIAHLPRVVDVYAWQGAELDCVAFDELTHFEEFQFWYLLSRLRSHSGDVPVRPYARFTCNPDPDSWVRSLVDWWIGEDGFAIEERAGVIRWFVRVDSEGDGIGELVWGDSAEELLERYPGEHPVSFTFVHGRREDNPSGSWGEYERKLANLPVYLRRQLLEGNWNARRPISGSIYRLPETALFNDTDANFIAALDQVHSTARQYGAWDYGRRSHALCWGGAVLQPGAPPVLWVVDFIGWPAGTDALAAAQERALRSGLPVLGLEAYAWQMDSGDPSGEAKDSGEGWYLGQITRPPFPIITWEQTPFDTIDWDDDNPDTCDQGACNWIVKYTFVGSGTQSLFSPTVYRPDANNILVRTIERPNVNIAGGLEYVDQPGGWTGGRGQIRMYSVMQRTMFATYDAPDDHRILGPQAMPAGLFNEVARKWIFWQWGPAPADDWVPPGPDTGLFECLQWMPQSEQAWQQVPHRYFGTIDPAPENLTNNDPLDHFLLTSAAGSFALYRNLPYVLYGVPPGPRPIDKAFHLNEASADTSAGIIDHFLTNRMTQQYGIHAGAEPQGKHQPARNRECRGERGRTDDSAARLLGPGVVPRDSHGRLGGAQGWPRLHDGQLMAGSSRRPADLGGDVRPWGVPGLWGVVVAGGGAALPIRASTPRVGTPA